MRKLPREHTLRGVSQNSGVVRNPAPVQESISEHRGRGPHAGEEQEPLARGIAWKQTSEVDR